MDGQELYDTLRKLAPNNNGVMCYLYPTPNGYKCIAYRPPKKGEQFVGHDGQIWIADRDYANTIYPILERERVQIGYKVVSLGRPPKVGEFYKNSQNVNNPKFLAFQRTGSNDDYYRSYVAVAVEPIYDTDTQ